jgi:hypothetical protein
VAEFKLRRSRSGAVFMRRGEHMRKLFLTTTLVAYEKCAAGAKGK